MTRTAADDTAIRLAVAMLVADTRANLTPTERARIIERLQRVDAAGQYVPFSDALRAMLREPLLAYIAAYHPRIVEIVRKQFTETGAEEGPQGGSTPARPSTHYGLVPERA